MLDFKKYEIDQKYFQIEFPVDAAIAVRLGNKVTQKAKDRLKEYNRKMKVLQDKKDQKWEYFKLDVKLEHLHIAHIINYEAWNFIFEYVDRKFSSYPYKRMYEEILDIVEAMIYSKQEGK